MVISLSWFTNNEPAVSNIFNLLTEEGMWKLHWLWIQKNSLILLRPLWSLKALLVECIVHLDSWRHETHTYTSFSYVSFWLFVSTHVWWRFTAESIVGISTQGVSWRKQYPPFVSQCSKDERWESDMIALHPNYSGGISVHSPTVGVIEKTPQKKQCGHMDVSASLVHLQKDVC